MWFLTAIFQAVAQAVTWVLPVSESGHSAIFHDFSGRFSGNGSELTGLVHIGIALGIFLVFIKLFVRLFGEFIAFFKDAFAKQNPFVNPGGARRFMFGTVLGFLPMVLLLLPAGKYGNVYGLFRSMGYNGTLLDEGVFFALTGGLILLALLQMKKHGPQKNVDWYAALILGFAAAFSLPIAGLSYMGVLFCLGVMMGVARKISYRFAAVSSVLTLLVQERCMWRSLWYFALSVGLFSGVVTNQLFLDQALSVRFAVIAAAVSIAGVVLSMYGFLLHGILETLGAMAGDAVGLICLLGYTTLPFLVMTPVALLGTKLGLPGMLVVVGACITAKLWMLYLLIRALQVVYLIDFKRSLATVAFSLLLLYIAFVLPLQIVFELLMLKIS